MRKILSVLLLCLFVSLGVSGQKKGQARLDSMAAVLPGITADTSRIRLLTDLSIAYSDVNTTIGLQYGEQAIALAAEKNLNTWLLTAYTAMSVNYKQRADYLKANEYNNKALGLGYRLNDKKAVGTALNGLASSYFYQGDYSKAIDYYLQALKINEELGSRQGIGNILLNMGNVYYFMKEYEKALSYFERANHIYESQALKKGYVTSLANMGYVNLALGNYGKALDYINRSQKIYEELGDNFGIGSNAQAMGRVYLAQRNYLKAVESYQTGLRFSEKVGNKLSQAQNLLTIGEAYVAVVKDSVAFPFAGILSTRKGLLDQALENTNKAIALRSAANDMNGLNFAYDTKSEIEALSGNAVAALASYQKHILYRDSVFNLEKTREINRRELQYEFGKREDSLKFQQAITAEQLAKQELVGQQQQQQLTLQQQKLLLSNKEKDLQRLTYLQEQAKMQHEQERQASLIENSKLQAKFLKETSGNRIAQQQLQISTDERIKQYLALVIGIVLVVAFLVYYSQQRTKRLNTIILKQKAELEELGHVKDRIFSLVSHDMRTPVNTLISFIDILEDADIPQEKLKAYSAELKNQLSHTSVLMENLLSWASSQMKGFAPRIGPVQLRSVVEETIVLLSRQAAYKNIRIHNATGGEVRVSADRNMLGLVIRNTISNAIKFTQPDGEIVIDAVHNEGKTNVTVRDNGTGMPPSKVNAFNDPGYLHSIETKRGTQGETGTGLGLMLCKTFAALMHGSVYVSSQEGGGTVFTLVLPSV